MLIDSHSHLNFVAFEKDKERTIKRALKEKIWIINVGSNYQTSQKAVEITENYREGVYAAIGLHPIHLETGLIKIKDDKEEIEIKTKEENFDYQKYKELTKSEKVVAIGETGLDYYWKPKTTQKKELFKQKQKELFLKELELAEEMKLPVIFHCRMAHQDLIEVLKSKIKRQKSKIEGVVHCFTGNLNEAQEYLKMGLYLGFNGLIFKMDFDKIIEKMPLEKILIETDCPYLVPPQIGGRNEPIYLKYIAQKIAEIKNISFEKVAKITTQNAKKLFNLR